MSEKLFTPPKENEPWDVIILGSGPAGLTAAIYTTRGAASTLLVAGYKWGGQLMLTTQVDNYPGFPQGVDGPILMQQMKDQALRFGTEWVDANCEEVDFSSSPFKVKAGDKTYLGKSILIATGAETVWLGVPGESKLMGRGVSSCAPCDAPFFKNKKVAVVGGGDSAMEEALVLSKYATEVTLIHRRDSFRASVAMQEKLKANKVIKIQFNTQVKEIIGETKVERLKLISSTTGEESEMNVDGIFVAIGHSPSTKLFEKQIELDEKGFVKVFDHTKTSLPGVYTAGDVHDHHYKQAVTAAGFGCMAAMDLLIYLDSIKSN